MTVTYPILIGLVMEQMLGITDTIFLGRVGETELGAAAIAGIGYLVLYMIGFGFSIGAQIIIGRRNGEGEFSKIGSIFRQGMFFLIILATIMVIFSEWLAPSVMKYAISSPHIMHAVTAYLKWRIPSLFFSFAAAMFRAVYIGTTKTKVLTYSSIIMLLSNMFLNWTLIFGHFGLPALGIEGAAIGSSMSEAISLAYLIIYTLRKLDLEKYGMERKFKFDKRELKDILSVSVWSMIQNFLSVFSWMIFFLLAEHLGEEAIAISNIVRNASGLIWMILTAFAITGSTLASNLIGEGRSSEVMPLIGRLLKISYAVIIPIMVVFFIFPGTIIRIFTNIPGLIDISIPSMLVMTASYVVSVPGIILFQAVAGTGNTQKAFILEVAALSIYVAYCYAIMYIIKADIAVCWTADSVYALATVIFCGLYLKSGRWKGKKI